MCIFCSESWIFVANCRIPWWVLFKDPKIHFCKNFQKYASYHYDSIIFGKYSAWVSSGIFFHVFWTIFQDFANFWKLMHFSDFDILEVPYTAILENGVSIFKNKSHLLLTSIKYVLRTVWPSRLFVRKDMIMKHPANTNGMPLEVVEKFLNVLEVMQLIC